MLADLDERERKDVAQQCRWRRYGAGEQIIDRQNETTDIFFVVDGTVRVVNYSLSGREVTFDDLSVGCHFGELAAVDSEPRSASVMALTQCNIASMTQDRFLHLLEKNPAIALKLMRGLTRMVRAATLRIMDLSTLAANNRVQADLLRQARNRIDAEGRAVISPIPVHADIASRVSTTRETVARVLNDLARKGIVIREKNALIITDLENLQEMVEDVRGD
ncbi:MAG: Crp/Fnr family transcriptional regulator [Rhodospirillales bacterium]|nr:Crp/Fnr family transcriptional regulator [Rhodospirillales bacterium]